MKINHVQTHTTTFVVTEYGESYKKEEGEWWEADFHEEWIKITDRHRIRDLEVSLKAYEAEHG